MPANEVTSSESPSKSVMVAILEVSGNDLLTFFWIAVFANLGDFSCLSLLHCPNGFSFWTTASTLLAESFPFKVLQKFPTSD
jgi:hypothetical protein